MEKNKYEIVKDYYKSIQNKNISSLLNCLHDHHQSMHQFEEIYKPVFEHFTLTVDLIAIKVLGEDEKHIIVKDLVDTKKLSGPIFKDNRTSTVHILEQDTEGKWKILNSTMVHMENL
jgi:hypothetical protein